MRARGESLYRGAQATGKRSNSEHAGVYVGRRRCVGVTGTYALFCPDGATEMAVDQKSKSRKTRLIGKS